MESNIISNVFPAATSATPQPVSASITKNQWDAVNKYIDRVAEAGSYIRDRKQVIISMMIGFNALYIAADPNTQKGYEKALDNKCSELEIENIGTTTVLHKLCKIAFADDTKPVSAMAHVALVLIAWGVKEHEALARMAKEGGIQKIRTTFKRDGSVKAEKPSKEDDSGSTNNKLAVDKFAQARKELAAHPICTIPAQNLPDLSRFKEDAECTAIVVRRPDGSLVIKAIVEDTTVTDAAYAAYATYAENNAAQKQVQEPTTDLSVAAPIEPISDVQRELEKFI